MGIWPALIKNNLSKIIKQNFDEVLFICLFLFCVALSSSTSSEAEDISSAFKGADDFFSAFWGAEELKFWLKMVCLSPPSAWYCWMHWYKASRSVHVYIYRRHKPQDSNVKTSLLFSHLPWNSLDPSRMFTNERHIYKFWFEKFFALFVNVVIPHPDSQIISCILPYDHLMVVRILYVKAVGSSDDMLGGNQGTSTHAVVRIGVWIFLHWYRKQEWNEGRWNPNFILLSLPYSHQPGVLICLQNVHVQMRSRSLQNVQVQMYSDTTNLIYIYASNNSIVVWSFHATSTSGLWIDIQSCNITTSFIITYENNLPFGKQWQLWHTSPTPHIWSSPSSHSQSMIVHLLYSKLRLSR